MVCLVTTVSDGDVVALAEARRVNIFALDGSRLRQLDVRRIASASKSTVVQIRHDEKSKRYYQHDSK